MDKDTALTKARELQQQLARELQAQDRAKQDLDAAQDEYDAAITAKLDALREELEAEHADIVQRKEDAEQRVKAHKQPIRDLREEAKSRLDEWSMHLASKPVTGFERKAYFDIHVADENKLFAACLQYAPHVLEVDHKALSDFIRAHSTQDGEQWELDAKIITLLGQTVWAYTDYRWQISNKKLSKVDLESNE